MSEEKIYTDQQDDMHLFDIEDVDFDDEVESAPESKERPAGRTVPEKWPTMKTGGTTQRRPVDKSLDIPAFERRQQRRETERNLAPKRVRRKKSFFEEYGRYVIGGAAAVIAVIVLAVTVPRLFKGKVEPPEKESSSYADESSGTVPEKAVLEKNAVSELITLMNTYYDSLTACDLDTLRELVEDSSSYTPEKLAKQKQYIEDYLNITCYTKPGLNEGEYVLYVYSEIKFANIDTPAPQLNHYYINQPEKGKFRIANGMLDNDKIDCMKDMDDDDDVQALIDEVYAKLDAARESDDKLNDLVEMLNRVPGTAPDESQGGNPSQEPSSDPATEPPATEPPATEPPATEPPETTSGAGEDTFYVNGELFYRVDEIVYPKEEVRVRALNSLESDVVGKLQMGDYVRRTGYSENWSQIEYDGFIAYVYKGFLTTNKP